MPYIDEKDLLKLHNLIDKGQEDLIKVEGVSKRAIEKFSTQRKLKIIFLVTTLLSLLFIGYVFLIPKNPILAKISIKTAENYSKEKLEEQKIKEDSLISKISDFQSIINQLEANNSSLSNNIIMGENAVDFGIQIGAYRYFDLGVIDDEVVKSVFSKRKSSNGLYNYTIGNFETYQQASAIKEGLLKLGFNDSFITSRVNGKEVNINEALKITNETQYMNLEFE